MRNAKSSARTPRAARRAPVSVRASGPSAVTDDRRTRLRLRELCDEVLASYRIACEGELFTDADRREARKLLGDLPLPLPTRG